MTDQQSARVALQGYRRSGFTTVDPDNIRHIELYQHLRKTMDRIYPKTFLLHLNGAKQETTAGSGWAIKYWGVPKKNFPEGLPPDIAAAEKSPDAIQELELAGGSNTKVDTDNLYVIDKKIPRKDLGDDVVTLKLFGNSALKLKDKQPATGGAQPSGDQQEDARQPQAANQPPQPQTADQPSQPQATTCQVLVRAPVKREASDPWDDDPEAKRIKTLQSDVLRLKTNIQKAADANQWSSASSMNTDNVKTMAGDLPEVLGRPAHVRIEQRTSIL